MFAQYQNLVALYLQKKDLSLYSTGTQNYWRWVLLRHLTQKIALLR